MITRYTYPLSLRERVSHLCYKYNMIRELNERNVTLEFNKTIKLDLKRGDIGHRSIILNGFYELKLSKRINSLSKKGGLLMDVGANYGYFSCLWAAKQNSNYVIGFEANPANIDPLMENIRKNNLIKQVTINALALGIEKGRMMFYTGGETDQTGWGGLMPYEGKNSIQVEVETLDNIALQQNIDRIDVLKIDTEGADTWILKGASNLLRKKQIKHIFYESNLPRMSQLNIRQDEAQDFLVDCGYQVNRFDENEYYASIK